MASIGQVPDSLNGISRQTPTHPAAFSNTWAPDYRDRYMMEMQTPTYHGRLSSFDRNGTTTSSGYRNHLSMESAPLVWRQRQLLELDDTLLVSNHSIHPADNNNNINNGSRRGAEGSSSRIPSALLGRSTSMNRDSHASIPCSPSELYDRNSGSAMTGDWQAFVDSDAARYSSLLPSMMASSSGLQQPPSSVGGANERAMIRELIGKLGGSSSSSSLMSSSPSSSQQPAGGGEGGESLAAGNHRWNSGSNAMAVEMPSNVGRGPTVDPSKGGLLLNHEAAVAAGKPTPHGISPFSADPGFAERAAKFSSFSNGNYARSFPSNSDSGGPARTRSRSGVSPRSPGTCTSPLQESLGRVVCNDNSAVEGRSDSRIREIQAGNGGVSDDLVPLAVAANRNDENSLEQNHVRADGYVPSSTLSRTASSLLRSAKTGEDEGERPLGASAATSTGASSGIKRGISPFTREQGDSAGSPLEACPSPTARSGVTDISFKKRKPTFEERPYDKHPASGSASSHHEKDAKTEAEDAKVKRLRRGDGFKDKDDRRAKADRSGSETSGDSSPRSTKHSTEHPKSDYIHVRARRGQATDSHSLAERVRREKISERMKFLQDLVPGCSKVTGKAVMLDEIINYVQSLQRQVEFLSMKLAFQNPRLDFHHERFLGKEGPDPGSQAMVLGSETSIAYPPLQPQQHQTQQLQHGLEYQVHAENTGRQSRSAISVVPPKVPRVSQVNTPYWDDGELHSIVQMGFGNVPPEQVKVELQQSPIACL